MSFQTNLQYANRLCTAQSNMQSRYPEVDIFRGLTIALMIIVNSFNPQAHCALLQHATWNGCTLADLVFPFFLLALGMSLVLKHSLTHLALMQRSVFLFCLGLGLNAFPHTIHLRIPGVLQRIALCYLCAGYIYRQNQAIHKTLIFTLLTYWMFNLFYPTIQIGHLSPGWTGNALGWIDQRLFSPQHLLSPYFDPEGFMSTFGALATTLVGIQIGQILIRCPKKLWQQGLIYLSFASIWQLIYPLNKSIWTGSYVLWTAGIGTWVLACCQQAKYAKAWLAPFENMGRHSLLLFVLHVIGLKLLYLTHLWPWHLTHFDVNISALSFSLAYTLLFLVLIWLLPLKKTSYRTTDRFQEKSDVFHNDVN